MLGVLSLMRIFSQNSGVCFLFSFSGGWLPYLSDTFHKADASRRTESSQPPPKARSYG